MEGLGQLVVFGALFGVMWFVLIRPQRKKQREQQEMVERLATGDSIVTIGGLHGEVVALTDTTVDLAVDVDGTVLRFQRTAVASVLGGPGDGASADEDAA